MATMTIAICFFALVFCSSASADERYEKEKEIYLDIVKKYA